MSIFSTPSAESELLGSMCDRLVSRLKSRSAPIIAISLIRDEQDILESFVRHTLDCVDGLLIVNHRSCDASRQILESLSDEGLPLSILDARDLGKRQSAWHTALAVAAAARLAAKVIVPLDADEFLVCAGDGEVRDHLSSISSDEVRIVHWRAYVPLESDNETEPNILRRITHRMMAPPLVPKVIVGGSIAAHPSFRLNHGSHEVVLGFDTVKYLPDANIALAHFPVRSVAQFTAKIAVSQLTIPLVQERSPLSGTHYDGVRSLVPISLSMTPKELSTAAMIYAAPNGAIDETLVRDPVVSRDHPLRYSDGRPADPLARVESVARELANPNRDIPNGLDIGRFVEPTLVAENEHMRRVLQSIDPEWSRSNPGDLEDIFGRLRSSEAQLASIYASGVWRALAPYRKLRNWIKVYRERRTASGKTIAD